ncbi:uncharacterized protein LOC142317348 [Lycorma delicatula]|uniref:uncharacterized protein LOC142317339 n=1 Tax=Lycorma delicatula TaxID=130591 RepID=UPI003F5106CA
MKKIGQGSRRSVSCDNVPFKTNRSSSLKCKTGSKAEEKIERQRISRVRFKENVLQKVNIPFEEQIYKNLVDLKVSDNDLHYGQDKRIKSKHFERIKDKEPELSEFYEPSFNEEYVLKIEKLQIDPLKVISYDGFSISDRMKNWQIS